MHEWLQLQASDWHCLFNGDLLQFSYWLCGNIPAPDDVRMSLLALDCPNERLRSALTLLQTFSHAEITCKHCDAHLSDARSVFAMSASAGLMGAYVNPNGKIHILV